jgi:hypothetical protein
MNETELKQNYLEVNEVEVTEVRVGGLPYLEIKLLSVLPMGSKCGLRGLISLN